MSQYEELLGRVTNMETQVQLMRAEKNGGVTKEIIEERLRGVESELRSLKSELVSETVESERVHVESHTEVEKQVHQAMEFRIRNVEHAERLSFPENPVVHQRRHKDMEFQVGKTVMSVLASLLILVSIVLFGSIVYPMLSTGAKVVLIYAISIAFTGVGLWGMKGKYRVFFTAFAGCGVGAFYVSSIISYFIYGVFNVMFLGVLIYAWVFAVAWISKSRVPVFAYICYLGILVSTVLCVVQFPGSVIAVGCYLVSIVTLYLFTRTGEYKKDAFYFVQFPVVIIGLVFCYPESFPVIMWMMLLCAIVYAIQYHLYKEKTQWYKVCLIATEVMLYIGYLAVDDILRVSGFLNVYYVFLTACVAIWSYRVFDDKFLKVAPLCVMSALLPILNYGSFYEEYIGFAPFAMAMFIVAYFLRVNVMKGIACGYMLVYIWSSPSNLSSPMFFFILGVAMIELGVLFFTLAFESDLDRAAFMLLSCASLYTICQDGTMIILAFAYAVAVSLSAFFNSDYFVQDDVSQRLGWAWNGFWMGYGSCVIMDTGREEVLKLVVMFLLVLVAFMVNVKWQLGCDHPIASLEFCLKSTWFLFMLLMKLEATGVAMSVAFLLMAVWCVVLGAMVRHKIIRLYGLVLTILSVLKCLLLDISYSSSIARPIGLLVAGLLCFGVSWVYSVLERKLNEDTEE